MILTGKFSNLDLSQGLTSASQENSKMEHVQL